MNKSTTSSKPVSPLVSNWDHSWFTQLTPESDPPKNTDNRSSRRVLNGHFVPVLPTPLKSPTLVTHSRALAKTLGLSEETDISSPEFLRFFSGDVKSLPGSQSWATPYALSIMGKRYTNNCPFGTGDGYGDGRAISIGEAVIDDRRWEFQLKGAGRTPFCRGADGRAVLRSSIREFLASEAMFHLGVDTTRALSLIVSGGDKSSRPWYSDQVDGMAASEPQLPTVNDPRLARYPMEQRLQIIEQLKRQKRDPDVMIQESNAITCRVSTSFLRIGHVDLFARRVLKSDMLLKEAEEENEGGDGELVQEDARRELDSRYDELEKIIWHAAFREFPDLHDKYYATNDIDGLCVPLLQQSSAKIAKMVAGWIRVGFAQGNFNADNCLVGGRTMDYGPFGFMDEYDPLFAKWTGSGEHFGFMNQPQAGYVNFSVLAQSVLQVVLRNNGKNNYEQKMEEVMSYAKNVFQQTKDEVWQQKLGFCIQDTDQAVDLWKNLEPILKESQTDWTVFWRQLSYVAKEYPLDSTDYGAMLDYLMGDGNEHHSPFYKPLTDDLKSQWINWIELWRLKLEVSSKKSTHSAEELMLQSNPKYTLREWIFVDAYQKASKGDYSLIEELSHLVSNPYDEGSAHLQQTYYRKATLEDLIAGGTAFMS